MNDHRKNEHKTTTTLFPSLQAVVDATDSAEAAEHTDEDDGTEPPTTLRTTDAGVTELSSLCMHCHQLGTTRMLLTSIPFFREVVISSFACGHCNFRDSEIMSGGVIQERGLRCVWRVESERDMCNRQIVKSETAQIWIPSVDFTIPATARGVVTTLEGLLREALEALTESQSARVETDPVAAKKIDEFLPRLRALVEGGDNWTPFEVVLEDPAGNSCIESFSSPRIDANLRETHFARTPEQNDALGLAARSDAPPVKAGALIAPGMLNTSPLPPRAQAPRVAEFANHGHSPASPPDEDESERVRRELLSFPANCPACQTEGRAATCVLNVPFFKDIIVMSFNCDNCGFKDTEVKGGGAIPDLGRRDTLKVVSPEDLVRDVVKSDTAGVLIPELQLESTRGSLGGMYTTVEGIVRRMHDDLFQQSSVFVSGDSSRDPERVARVRELEAQFDDCLSGRLPFTLVIEDPLANSYVYSPCGDPALDPRLKVETYERSWDEDEELGLHHMKVDQSSEALPALSKTDVAAAELAMSRVQAGASHTHPTPGYTQGSSSPS